jgi:hypothetical protein
MKVVKLTKKAQDIVNQIMSADAIDFEHGPVVERVTYGNMNLEQDKLVLSVDGDFDEIDIKNETLNEAVIVDGVIQIDANHIKDNHIKDYQFCDMTITLYKLSKIAAL